jgi:hypothetical protein
MAEEKIDQLRLPHNFKLDLKATLREICNIQDVPGVTPATVYEPEPAASRADGVAYQPLLVDRGQGFSQAADAESRLKEAERSDANLPMIPDPNDRDLLG